MNIYIPWGFYRIYIENRHTMPSAKKRDVVPTVFYNRRETNENRRGRFKLLVARRKTERTEIFLDRL